MINELHKKNIKKICFNLLGKENIILIRLGGSHAYNNANKNSDYDVIVITKDKIKLENTTMSDNSYQLLCLKNLDFIDKIDLFVIDYKNAVKMHNLDNDTNLYMRLFIDNVQNISENLIFKNSKFNNEFSKYINIKLEDKIILYYENIIHYYKNVLKEYPTTYRKHEYHIFRFLDNFIYFEKHKKYIANSKGSHYELMNAYKKSNEAEYLKIYRKQLEKALQELERIVINYKEKNNYE